MICWDTTKSEDKVIGVICGTLFVSGDDRLICWGTAKSEDKLTKSEIDTTESVVVFGRGTKCCRLNTILPVGTAIKFPVLEYLFGGLMQADIRSLVKWERSGDLPGFIVGAGIGL